MASARDLTYVKWHPATGICLTNKVTLGSARMNEPRGKSEVNDGRVGAADGAHPHCPAHRWGP